MSGSRSVETSEKVSAQRKAGERKTAGKTAHAVFVPVGFLIRFSDYLGAWNRLVPMDGHSVYRVFCKHCALMIPMHCRKDKGAFDNKPFINWRKASRKGKKTCLEQMKYHHDAMIVTESFLNSVENPEQNVSNLLLDEKGKNYQK